MPRKITSTVRSKSSKKLTVKDFEKKLQSDRLTRLRFVNGLADLLEDMGLSQKEISAGLPTKNILSKDSFSGGGPVQIVFTSKSDTQKNSSSVVIF